MSTKTTIKRIALVAVSALGMGLLSVVPALAALDTTVAVVTAGSTNLSGNVGTAITTTISLATTTDEGHAGSLTITPTIQQNVSSAATIGTPGLGVAGLKTAIITGSSLIDSATANKWTNTITSGVETLAYSSGTITAFTATQISTFSFTPTKPGAYIFRIAPSGAKNTNTYVDITVTAKAPITDLTVSKSNSAIDSSLFIAPSTGSAGARSYKIYTANSSIQVSDLSAALAGTSDTATVQLPYNSKEIDLAAGTTTSGLASTGAAAATSATSTTATSGTAVAFTGGSSLTSLTASSTGTSYLVFSYAKTDDSGLGTQYLYASGQSYAQLTIYQTTSTVSIASSAVTGAGASTPVVGANGQAGAYRIRYTTTASTDTVNPAARITSVPAGSKILNVNPLNSYYPVNNSSATSLATASSIVNGSAAYQVISNGALAPVAATAANTADAYFYFWPDVAGTYTVVFFDDRNSNGVVDGSDVATTVSYTVGATATAATITSTGDSATSATDPSASNHYGALLTVTLKDASGNPSVPDSASSVTVTASGSALFTFKNGGAIANLNSINLTAGDFNGKGQAFLNITDSTAETSTISLVGNGSAAGVTASFNQTFRTAVVSGAQFTVTALQTTGYTGSSNAYTVPLASSVTWTATGTASTSSVTSYQAALITDTAGNVLGTKTNNSNTLKWVLAKANGTTGKATWTITPTAATSAAEQYRITGQTTINTTGTDLVVTSAAPAITSGTITFSPAVVRLAYLGSVTHTITLTDQFGNAVPNATVTFSRAGRNSSTVSTVVMTDANGQATYTTTDAAASTNATSSDVVTASASYTNALASTSTLSATATITYSTAGVGSILMDSDNYTAGVANATVSAQKINATSYTGAQAGAVSTVDAYVYDTNKNPMAGVPVTFSVAGTGAAILSTKKVVYTDATGLAATSVYAWLNGTYTITATAGTVSATATETFAQQDATSVRSISAAANGSTVVATVKDRFGNPVAGATVYAKVSAGTGYFGTGQVISAGVKTLPDGTASFVVLGGAATVVVSTVDPSAVSTATTDQTQDAAGYVFGTAATGTAFTAATVGTATTAEKGVGSTYSAAGVGSATADVTSVITSDAIDAANEATDAANAATDAANAAAEAADAATAAAQDAQAAVAALASQVADLIAGIKAQITALTNLVIKIQKKVKA